MRALLLALLLVACAARADEQALQRAFEAAMQAQQAGELSRAEAIFREMLKATQSPRVRLELARTLFLQGKYAEAKALFKEVSLQSDTPWRVRDNIALFVSEIEERTGYFKFGVNMVADSNPGNLARQKEFAIGDLRVTPVEAPKKLTGLRYSARAWLPIERLGAGGYVAASYVDYPEQDFDRLTVDAGLAKNLVESGRLRGKAGMEFGTQGGNGLYRFPYVGLDAVVAQSESYRLASEAKLGRVLFPDFDYLDSTFLSGALSLRRVLTPSAAGTLRVGLETSRAREQAYSYYGWDVGPGVNVLWPQRAFVVGANLTYGSRKYGDADPLFGIRRVDERTRFEVSLGNKNWRWRDNHVALVGSVEETRSEIEFYSYRKINFAIVIE